LSKKKMPLARVLKVLRVLEVFGKALNEASLNHLQAESVGHRVCAFLHLAIRLDQLIGSVCYKRVDRVNLQTK
jgi:hypothetical protein